MEQESSYDEQQKKQELYEHDADFAHSIASQLNQLIDEGVLTVQDVERASHEIFDEFLYRFRYPCIDDKFSDRIKNKIKRFFRGEPVESVDIKERGPVKEQYIAMMQEIFEVVKRLSPHISGMLLFGSRMGDYADSRSDCDFKFIFQNKIDSTLLELAIAEVSDKIYESYSFPKYGKLYKQIQELGSLTIEELKMRLEKYRYFDDILPWAWDPRRVRYIGDDEENMNKQIQQALNSNAFKQYKEETLNRIKKLVKQRAQIRGG